MQQEKNWWHFYSKSILLQFFSWHPRWLKKKKTILKKNVFPCTVTQQPIFKCHPLSASKQLNFYETQSNIAFSTIQMHTDVIIHLEVLAIQYPVLVTLFLIIKLSPKFGLGEKKPCTKKIHILSYPILKVIQNVDLKHTSWSSFSKEVSLHSVLG